MKTGFCGCCGHAVEVEDNVNSEDVYCQDCMGYGNSKNFKRAIGWAGKVFFGARFPVIRKNLKQKNRPKWDKLSYPRKCSFVAKMIEQGAMI